MTIGAIIRQLRQEQNITQEQLAEALGITSRAVSQWECDRTAPDISQLPALAHFFDVTTDRLLGVDIRHKEDEVRRILKQVQKFQQNGDQGSIIDYLREQIKIYPNEPEILTQLAFALQNYYFAQGKADAEALKQETSNAIIALCERALKYGQPAEDNSFPKQILILQYIRYMHDKEKAKKIVDTLPDVFCTREMFLDELYEGKEALERKQADLLWSYTQMLHNLFWKLSCDDSYNGVQKLEILKADAAMIQLITGGKPNFFECQLSLNAVSQAVHFLNLGDEEKALDMLETAYDHADRYENRPDGEAFAPCWLSELEDKRESVSRSSPDTVYDSVYHIILKPEHPFIKVFGGNERFEKLLGKLKGKIRK